MVLNEDTKRQIRRRLLVTALLCLMLNVVGCGFQTFNRSPARPIPPAIDFVRAQPVREIARQRSLEELPSVGQMIDDISTPKTAEEAQKEFETLGGNWLYGHGVGRSIGNIGTGILFPPYAVYLLGNAGLSLAGFQQLKVTNLLPDAPKYYVLKAYDSVTSVPGRLIALVGSEEFRETTGTAKETP